MIAEGDKRNRHRSSTIALTLHEVVTDAALRDRSERANRALSIVEQASSKTPKAGSHRVDDDELT